MEGNDGRTVDVVGHKEALETTLRDRIDDIDDADRSGPSRRTDFSQSTRNSTNNTDATTRMHTHRKRALTTIALVNKNSTLTSNLENTEEHLHAMIAQNIALQRQLAAASNNRPFQEQDNDITMEEEGPAVLRGGGDQGSGSEDELSESPKEDWDLDWDLYRGCAPGWGRVEGTTVAQRAEQELTDYTELPLTTKGWMDFYDAAVIHWKWPAIDPQHPHKPLEPPPGHAFNVYVVTSAEFGSTQRQLVLFWHTWGFCRGATLNGIRRRRRRLRMIGGTGVVLTTIGAYYPGTQMRPCGSVHSASWPSYIETVLPRNCGNLRKRGIAA